MMKDRLNASVVRVNASYTFLTISANHGRDTVLHWIKPILNLLLKLMRFAEATLSWEYCLASISV